MNKDHWLDPNSYYLDVALERILITLLKAGSDD